MRLASKLFAALCVLFAAQTASAQSNYPNRPVKILVGFTPGTAPDLRRAFSPTGLRKSGARRSWSRIPGAGSNIATDTSPRPPPTATRC